jgi:NAD-dependent DNA ligase
MEILDYYSEMYYNGTPVISDKEFDALALSANYESVGHSQKSGCPHLHQMYSLRKVFDIDEVEKAFLDNCVVTDKLDGAAISLIYSGGKLKAALTRGDGIRGQLITDKVRFLVPNEISDKNTVQITGEVVAPSSIPNARNYAAGALNLKSISDFIQRELTFFAYDMVPNNTTLWSSQMNYLFQQGFRTVLTDNADKFPKDGKVYRINDYPRFLQAGKTAHHPKGAFALKEQKDGVVTTLNDVVWQVGKSGVVSPVGILEPITIEDATVSRVTLHNIKFIEMMKLEIGCQVEVIRSGEIIPRVVRRVD